MCRDSWTARFARAHSRELDVQDTRDRPGAFDGCDAQVRRSGWGASPKANAVRPCERRSMPLDAQTRLKLTPMDPGVHRRAHRESQRQARRRALHHPRHPRPTSHHRPRRQRAPPWWTCLREHGAGSELTGRRCDLCQPAEGPEFLPVWEDGRPRMHEADVGHVRHPGDHRRRARRRPVPLAGHWEVDPTHSALEFVARHAVFTLVRGRFTSFTGTLVIGPPHLGATRIDVDIDASSVDTAMAVRDTNLRSEERPGSPRPPGQTTLTARSLLSTARRWPHHRSERGTPRLPPRSSAPRRARRRPRPQG